ncbi:phosphoglucosamine mutase [Holdemania filiformis]|uniref:phosphoglucosamine mutase n=1 Tax=Holdemania filiformis TaxID=61171 RepID=UPI002431CDBC|nr:phosphoglucosamine mutase [Holdemania filiformis]
MGRYFGTDGIRGKANETLDVQRAFQVGRYLGYYFSRQGKGRILVGKDTRLSSGMFENAIAAGASASGADVYLLGYCPTPSVAYLVKREQFSCGVMISASHNPYYDNGIKVFSQAGIKLSAEIEALVEDYIDGLTEIPLVSGEKIGQVIRYDEGLEHYLDWLESLFDFRLEQFHLALDLANGSATTTAEKLLRRMGAHCTVIHSEPNGVNINTKCGSTHPESLQELMKSGIFDLGLAFDGDADRLIAVDPQGNLINGDYVLYICGKYLKENGLLHGNTVVSTVMANLGFFKAMEQLDIATESTQVGDKYVYECMVKNDYMLGGEQSGHIIFKEHATTGDGLLTALKLLEVMHKTGKGILALEEGLKIYPQLLINVPVKDKEAAMQADPIVKEVVAINEELHGNGRILVRPSGTEPLVRVMVEAESDELCHHYVYRVVDLIEKSGL